MDQHLTILVHLYLQCPAYDHIKLGSVQCKPNRLWYALIVRITPFCYNANLSNLCIKRDNLCCASHDPLSCSPPPSLHPFKGHWDLYVQ